MESFDQVYIYGLLDLGEFKKSIFLRPYTAAELLQDTNNIDGQIQVLSVSDEAGQCDDSTVTTLQRVPLDVGMKSSERVDMNLRICLLPGLYDLARVKESFTSATFTLQIHREALHARAFNRQNIQEYRRLVKAEDASKGGGGSSWILKSDNLLIDCIEQALATASQMQSHGCARFRLEQLLSSSEDLLKEFAHRRLGASSEEGRDDVVIKVITTFNGIKNQTSFSSCAKHPPFNLFGHRIQNAHFVFFLLFLFLFKSLHRFIIFRRICFSRFVSPSPRSPPR
jgi:hypothetical protein